MTDDCDLTDHEVELGARRCVLVDTAEEVEWFIQRACLEIRRRRAEESAGLAAAAAQDAADREAEERAERARHHEMELRDFWSEWPGERR